MAEDTVAVIRALGFKEVDLTGFSLGGFVVQQIVLDHPALIRKVILAGTRPAGGEGIERVGPVSWPLMMKGMLTFTDPKTVLFFTATTNGRRAAKAFLERLKERKADRDKPGTIAMLLQTTESDPRLGQTAAAGSVRHRQTGVGRQWRSRHHGADPQLSRSRAPSAKRRTRHLQGCRAWWDFPEP